MGSHLPSWSGTEGAACLTLAQWRSVTHGGGLASAGQGRGVAQVLAQVVSEIHLGLGEDLVDERLGQPSLVGRGKKDTDQSLG